MTSPTLSRRSVIRTALASAALTAVRPARAAPPAGPALIGVMLNLEMSRGYPTPDVTRWDFEKGNLDEASKQYTLELARRVKQRGGVVHGFLVGETLEQENIDWLKQLLADGHRIGNHTWHHVDLFAKSPATSQPRFLRDPSRVEGRELLPFLREEISRTAEVFRKRTGHELSGFRSPSERPEGIADRPDLQRMLKELGFTWIVTKYARLSMGKPGERPTEAIFDSIVAALEGLRPSVYPSGLIELPICSPTDIGAFRGAKWPLEDFREVIRRGVTWGIETGHGFRFTAHPSCMYVVDPKFTTIDLICDLVEQSKGKAKIAHLDEIAAAVKA